MSSTTEEASSSADERTASSDPEHGTSKVEPLVAHSEAPPETASGATPGSHAVQVRDARDSAGGGTTSSMPQPASRLNPAVLVEQKSRGATSNAEENRGAMEQKAKPKDGNGLAEPVSRKPDVVANRGQLGPDAPPELGQQQEKDANRNSPKSTGENVSAAAKSSDEDHAGSLAPDSSTAPESQEAGDRKTRAIPQAKSEGTSESEPSSSSSKPETSSGPTPAYGKSAAALSAEQARTNTAKTDELLEFKPVSRAGDNRGVGGAGSGSAQPRQVQGQYVAASRSFTFDTNESLSTAHKTEESPDTEGEDESARNKGNARVFASGNSIGTKSQEGGDRSKSTDPTLSASQEATSTTNTEKHCTAEKYGPHSFRKPDAPHEASHAESNHRLTEAAPLNDGRPDDLSVRSTRLLNRSFYPQSIGRNVSQNAGVKCQVRSRTKVQPGLLKDSQREPSQTASMMASPTSSVHPPFGKSGTFSVTGMPRPDLHNTAPAAATFKGRRTSAASLFTPVKGSPNTVKTKLVFDELSMEAMSDERVHGTGEGASKTVDKASKITAESMGVSRGLQKGHLPPSSATPALSPHPSYANAPPSASSDEERVCTPQDKILPTPLAERSSSKELLHRSHHSSKKHSLKHHHKGSKASPDGDMDHVKSTSGFGVNAKSESNKEASLLGRRVSHASTARSSRSRKSTMPPTAPDLAQAENLAIAEPGFPRVDQPAPSERYLYPMAICLAIALVLFLGFLFWPSSKPPSRDEDSALGRHSVSCSSASCIQNAVYLSNLLSWRGVDPCNDFYAFVCRRWKSRFATPLKDASVSTDDDYAAFLEDRIYVSIRNDSGGSKILRPLRYLHDKCMNVRSIEDGGWNALLELLSDLSLDGFPLTPPVRDSISVWSTAANILRKSGSAALLSVGVASHAASPKKDIVSVGPPELLTTTANVDANEAIRLYTAAVFAAIKALKKDYVPPVEILAIVKFASDLEKLGQSRVNADASKINVLDSRSDLLEFLTAVFRGLEGSIFTGARSYIAIHSPELVNDVIDMVVNTEPHTVMNYLGVRLMIQIAPFIPEAGLTSFYSTMVYGKHQTDLPRWQLCVRATEKALYPLVHSTLFHDARLKSSMPSIAEVVSKTIAAFIAEVEASSLFEDSSKAAIHRTLSTIAVNIVSPSWINDTASIADYVDGLPAFKATRRGLETYAAFFQHTFFDTLSRGTRTRWSRSIFSATCWYESYPRTVYVPLIAFNVTQAFQGSDDDYGQLSRLAPRLSRCLLDMLMEESNSTDDTVHWLTENTQSRLTEAENCLRERANSAGLRRLRDVIAARVALRLFKKNDAAKQELVTSLLDGRIMTSTQVFFVYLMLQSCETLAAPEQSWPAGVDDWSIALRDSGDFTKAYNCTSGSPMGAKQGCVG